MKTVTECTWANVRTALPAGLSEDSIEIIRRATAPYRHEQRVIAAVKMAVAATADAAAEDEAVCSGRTLLAALSDPCRNAAGVLRQYLRVLGCVTDDARMRHIMRAEMLCVVGSMDVPYTARPSAFAGAGKGRRQASDGDAWTAAIHTARQWMADALYGAHQLLDKDVLTPETAVDLAQHIPVADARFVYDWLAAELRRIVQMHPENFLGFDAHHVDYVRRIDAALRTVVRLREAAETAGGASE